ncbi:unnamed protein product [Caenorhabditis brenneri]
MHITKLVEEQPRSTSKNINVSENSVQLESHVSYSTQSTTKKRPYDYSSAASASKTAKLTGLNLTPPETSVTYNPRSQQLIQERPRKPLRKLSDIPEHADRVYTNYGRIEIRGAQILKTLQDYYFSDDLIMSSLEDLIRRSPEISENVNYTNSGVSTRLTAGDITDFRQTKIKESVRKNCQNAVFSAGKRFDPFSKKLLLIPLYFDKHWMLVAILNPANCLVEMGSKPKSEKAVMYFLDPMGSTIWRRNERIELLILSFLMENLIVMKNPRDPKDPNRKNPKYSEKYQNTLFSTRNFVRAHPKNIPLQTNYIDCGPAVVNYMEGILDPFNGFLKQKDSLHIDWNDVSSSASFETVRHRVRARILNSATKENKKALEEIIERKFRLDANAFDEYSRSRRSRSVEKQKKDGASKQQKRHYSLDSVRGTKGHENLFSSVNPAKFCSHPATIAVRKLQVPEEYITIRFKYEFYH